MNKNILIVGSINVDYVIHTERLPKLGETITGSDFAISFGGKGANQAIAIAKSGCMARMLGAIGSDIAGGLALDNLIASGVDTGSVLKADTATGAAFITVCGGDNHIILDAGANSYMRPELIDEKKALFEWADIVVMQFEIPIETVIASAKLAKQLGKTVILNPAPAKELDAELFKYVDLIIPNEFEAQMLTGIEIKDRTTASEAIKKLKELGCKEAIITLGKYGSAYSIGDDIRFCGVYDVQQVDSTAAGDSFIGGLCSKLCEGAAITDAVRYASAVSAICVGRKGAAVSIPDTEEVEAFLKTNIIKESIF